MRLAVALVSLLAIAAIVGSAVSVIDKDYPPRLAVEVKGVPGYIYYDRAYELTIEYANLGGRIGGPVELAAELPETFARADRIGDPARHGERLVWTLDGLDAREHGTVTITVQGTLPNDLTKAIYDLPGYEGHTAFVEGFDLEVSLSAGDATASTLAIADTGEPPPPVSSLTIVKQCDEGDTNGVVFEISAAPQPTLLQLECGQSLTIEIETGVEYTVSEDQEDGYAAPAFEDACAPDGIVELAEPDAVTCTVVNSLLDEEPLNGLVKDTLEEDQVLTQFEEFDWFITVPDTGGDWYLWDFLPPGFILTDVGASLGIECSPILVFGLVCSGFSTEEGEGEVVTLTVRASIICGHYTNVAKLFTGIEPPLVAHDSVTVCGDEDQEPPEELPSEDTSSGSPDRPWWERLWTLLFE